MLKGTILGDTLENTDRRKALIFIIILSIPIIALALLLSNLASNNQISYESFSYATLYIIPILLIIAFAGSAALEVNKVAIFAYAFGISLVIIFMVYYYASIKRLSSTYVYYLSIFTQIVIFAVIIVALSIFYNLFSNKLRKLPGAIGTFVNFIFFIPCLLNDFIAYIKGQFTNTPSVTYILMAIEVVLITLYIYIPSLLKRDITDDNQLLSEPVFLKDEQIIAYGEDLPKNKLNYIYDVISPKLNYSITMWIYLNVQQLSEIPKRIFSYGNDKLKIEYVSVNNSSSMDIESLDKNDTLKITFLMDNSGNEITTFTSIPKQKWNYIAVNYEDNYATLYINGEMLVTKDHSAIFPTYKDNDTIAIGNKDLDGAICNISYYDKVLSKSEIVTYYNLLINQNPPVNNIL